VFFLDCSKVKCIMVFGRKLRASEAISIWKQHHSIEQFWRRLKHDLQIHKVRLRNMGFRGYALRGVYGMIAIKLIAYLIMEKLYAMTGFTFQQIKKHTKREIDICSFFREHFHLFPVPQRL
jgi:transposase